MNSATVVAIAVIDTESAVFPPARWVRKFEMLPPGQAATSIRPSAMLGSGRKARTMRKVAAGKTTNCANMPTSSGLGARDRALKSARRRSRAIENMTIASTPLRTVSDSGLKFSIT